MRFGEILRQKRLSVGWTQQQLGERVGKSKNNISQYELNKREADYQTLIAFSRLLHTTIDELLGMNSAALPTALCEDAGARSFLTPPVSLPVYDALPLAKPDGFRYAPSEIAEQGTLFFFRAPDDAMSERRVRRGDILLIREDEKIDEGAMLLLSLDGKPALRILKRCGGGRVLLMTANPQIAPIVAREKSVRSLGRVLRAEFQVSELENDPFLPQN